MAEVDIDRHKNDLSHSQKKMFVSMVKEYPELNNKSNTPEARRQRTDAIYALKSRLKNELNFEISEGQVCKKLQNMKSRVKKKSEMRGMGKAVNMKEWEIEYLRFIEGDADIKILDVKGNEATEEVHNLPIKTEFLVSESDTLSFSEEGSENMNAEDPKPTYNFTSVEPEGLTNNKNTKERKRRLQETKETRDLSTPELKRLVLLEQLQYYRKKRQLTDIQIRRELQRERDEAAPNQWSDDD